MILSPATMADAAALAAILRDWIHEVPWMPRLHTPEEDLGFLHHLIETRQVVVARSPEPQGFIAVAEGEVDALYLAPQARNRGIGAALLRQAKAAQSTLTLWTFQANTGARRFYARHGFVETLQTDGSGNAERLPDVRLQWRQGGADATG